MKSTKQLFLTGLALAAFSSGAWSQTSDSAPPAPPKTAPQKTHKHVAAQKPVTAADIQALKDALAAQQQQIKQLSDLVESRDQKIEQLEQRLDQSQTVAAQAQTKADKAVAQTAAQRQTIGKLKSDVADLKTVSAASATSSSSVTPSSVTSSSVIPSVVSTSASGTANGAQGATLQNAVLTLQDSPQTGGDSQQVYNKAMESAITIRFKGINITPGGFAEAAFVRRSRELGADLTTPFNSLTMPGASQSQLSEFFGSARQSRPTVYVEGRVKNVDFSSYISGDFLSAGVTSTATQTNSYTLRLRQVWGQVKFDNGWKFLGGQAWSLVTEGKAGIAPSDDLGKTNDARPQTIDPGYNVGFSFARQYGLRLTKDFGSKVSVAFAIENAQGTVTTHNNAANFLLGEAGASNTYNTTANYTANPSPDLIAKIAFDPGFGHYEIFGLADRFADRIFPCYELFASAACGSGTAPSALNAYNVSKEGGGFGANARWTFAQKHIVFGLHGFGGSGIGRYGAAQLSDLSINPDGSVHLIKNLQGLSTLEWHGKKLDIYGYAGAEYAGRTYAYDPNLVVLSSTTGLYTLDPNYVGYGSPTFRNDGCYTEQPPSANSGFAPGSLSHCTGDTRAAIEGTAGFWYTFYQGSKGRFRFGTQYSYVTRQTWSGANSTGPAGIAPEGLDGMVFTSFRYYLP